MTDIPSATRRLVRWLEEDSLPLWASVGLDRSGGGFHEAIGQEGLPAPIARRARVQARQAYVYATAAALSWGGPERQDGWRAAALEGLDYLRSRFKRRDGLYRSLVGADGSAQCEEALLYDQAFVLFALASAYSIFPDQITLLLEARDLLRCVTRVFIHSGRGLREASEAHPFQSNPHMHLLEASLAWSELDRTGPWPTVADSIVELCLCRFIDAQTGALREFFDGDWRPAAGVDGRIVEPGHQFEWAWLLARWSRLRGRADALQAAERLFDIASSFGVDRQRGVAFNALLDDFSAHDRSARLWPQTERLKAALILSEIGDPALREVRRQEAMEAVHGLDLYLRTPVEGLWWDKLTPSGALIHEPASASSFYHIACAIAELAAYDARARTSPAVSADALVATS